MLGVSVASCSSSSESQHKNKRVGVHSSLLRKTFHNMVQKGSKAALLKAGHPPAVKAGGKRVAKKSLEDAATHGTSERETKRSGKLSRSLATSNRMQQVGLLLTGTLDKLSHDFPETPVSVRHSKVRPAVERSHSLRTFCIQQPRK